MDQGHNYAPISKSCLPLHVISLHEILSPLWNVNTLVLMFHKGDKIPMVDRGWLTPEEVRHILNALS